VIVGAVDLGTNSTRLLVADVVGGRVEELHRETRITRLGEGVDARRLLLPTAIARVRNCLVDYRRTLEELGAERTLLVATSAVRDAENGEAFLGEIEWSYAFATQLLDGDEEAALMRRGVASGRALGEATMIVDIGGGSTELILGDRRLSLDIGSVRLTERCVRTDPPSATELAAAAAAVRELLPDLHPERAIAVAGTVTTLAALDLGLDVYDDERVDGHVLTATAIEHELTRLASLTLTQRRQLPAMEPERAPMIVAGAVIVHEILDRYRLQAVEVSVRDLLDGAALLAAELPEPAEGNAPPGAYTCC
jgi:exopolyphosphatase / guanosine-5'-triphosphate,3'-diphosphate pyrophosphatase